MVDKTPDIVNPVFRSIVLMSKVLPLACVPTLFDTVLDSVNSEASDIQTQVLSVLREVMSLAVQFPADRQLAIVNCVAPRLDREIKQSQDIDILLFNLDFLAHVHEFLAFRFDDSQKAQVLETIKAQLGSRFADALPSVAGLARAWAPAAPPALLDSLMAFLFAFENQSTAVTVLCSMVRHRAAIYESYAPRLLELFLARIDQEEVDRAAFVEEDPEADVYTVTHYIQNQTNLLASLGSLITAFPELAKPHVDAFNRVVFQYLREGAPDVVDEPSAEGFEDDAGDLIEDADMEPEEVDEPMVTGDDSWKIRKAAIEFTLTVVKNFPQEFAGALFYVDEETNNLAVLNSLIRDVDIGVQKAALTLLEAVVQAYKEQLDADQFGVWFDSLVLELPANKPGMLSLFLSTLSVLQTETTALSEETAVQTIENFTPHLDEAIIPNVLNFIVTLFQTTEGFYGIVDPVVTVFLWIFSINKPRATVACMAASAQLFLYITHVSPGETITALASALLEAAGDRGEKMVQAIETLAVFVVCCPSSPSVSSAVRAIVSSFAVHGCAKIAAAAVSLILASPQAAALLPSMAPVFRDLTAQLIKSDPAVHYRALWSILLAFETGALDASAAAPAAADLVQILRTGDSRCRVLTLQIFAILPAIAPTALQTVVDVLSSPQVSDDVVDAAARLAVVVSSLLPAITAFVSSLIARGSTLADDTALQHFAFVIGSVSTAQPDYAKGLIGQFAVDNPFHLRCIGEIGSVIDLSDRSALLASIFAAANSPDRRLFIAATQCLGMAAVGSVHNILPRLIAALDSGSFAIWLFAVLALVKKFVKTGAALPDSVFDVLVQYLLANADVANETAQTVAACLALFVRLRPEFADRLLADATEAAAPVLLRGVAIFLETAPEDAVAALIPPLVAKIDGDRPLLSEPAVAAVEAALRFDKLRPQLAAHVPVLADSVRRRESHVREVHRGIEVAKVDYGGPFRLGALNAVIAFQKTVPWLLNFGDVFTAVREALDLRQSCDIQEKGFVLLTELAKTAGSALVETLGQVAEVLTKLETAVFGGQDVQAQLQVPYLVALVALSKVTERQRAIEFEELFARRKNDERVQKLQVEMSFAVDATPTQGKVVPASFALMQRFRPEAANVFSS
jgi:hypothetical protein